MERRKIILGLFILLPWLIGAGCGNGGSLSLGGSKDCGADEACFDERFKDCKPAVLTSKVQEGLVYRYEIIGPKNNRCEIKSRFTENTIDPKMADKDGFCLYNNSKIFREASAEILASGLNLPEYCSGPLIDYLNSLGGKVN